MPAWCKPTGHEFLRVEEVGGEIKVYVKKHTTEDYPRGEERRHKMASRQVSLSVNDVPIELDYFVHGFIDHTVGGILAALQGTGEIESLDVSIEGDKVTINLNNALVPINPFVNKIIRNTIVGMVSSLKGVSEINKMNIRIRG